MKSINMQDFYRVTNLRKYVKQLQSNYFELFPKSRTFSTRDNTLSSPHTKRWKFECMQGGLKNQADFAVIQGKAVIQNAHDLYMFSIDKIIKSEKVDWLCRMPAVWIHRECAKKYKSSIQTYTKCKKTTSSTINE